MAVFAVLAFAARARAETSFATSVAPVLEHNCTKCHGATKQKAGLRLDSLAGILHGSEDGAVVKPGDTQASELFRRVTLPPSDDDFMPSGEAPPLSPAELAVLGGWIAARAPATGTFEAGALAPQTLTPAAAPDYRPRLAEARQLARQLGVKLVPRSAVPTDGLVLRTASAPGSCTDDVLERLSPMADLIVDAELARTAVTNKGMDAVGRWSNLVRMDLTRTAVTSDGVERLVSLGRLESLNLTDTKVDGRGVALARKLPRLKTLWAFGVP